MDLENIVISEVRESQGLYDIAYMWNLRSNRNESIYKKRNILMKTNEQTVG